MKEKEFVSPVLLPGLDKQLNFLVSKNILQDKKVLVIGSSSEELAKRIKVYTGIRVELIVEDYESLMNSRLVLSNADDVSVKVMDFEHTDYTDSSIDIIFAQASASGKNRNSMLKEIKRILKTGGYYCVGEILKLSDKPPRFVEDIFSSSRLDPKTKDELIKFYTERKFDMIDMIDLNSTLNAYYSYTIQMLTESINDLYDQELSYYKKLINKISHESNAYLKLGGHRHIGFFAMLLMKTA